MKKTTMIHLYIMVILLLPFMAFPSANSSLTFQQVVDRILSHNPHLVNFQYELNAKDGLILQESLRLNPEISLEFENFGIFGEFSGIKELESTLQVGQTILLGHKREKRVQTAKLDKILALRDQDIHRANLLTEARKRFIDIQILQEKITLHQEMLTLAESFKKKILTRIEAGHSSATELPQAEMAVLRQQIMLKQLINDLATAHLRLSILWGNNQPDFENVEKIAHTPLFLPAIETFQQNLHQNPDILRLTAETDYKKSLLTVAQANKIPDLTLNAGFRHLNGPGGAAFTIGASLPIPLANKNQGEIAAAFYLLKKAEGDVQTNTLENKNEIEILYRNLKSTFENAQLLTTIILPKASETIQLTTTGYEMGKLPYLNVMEAFHTQLEVREEYLDTLGQFSQITADLERLSGAKPLPNN